MFHLNNLSKYSAKGLYVALMEIFAGGGYK